MIQRVPGTSFVLRPVRFCPYDAAMTAPAEVARPSSPRELAVVVIRALPLAALLGVAAALGAYAITDQLPVRYAAEALVAVGPPVDRGASPRFTVPPLEVDAYATVGEGDQVRALALQALGVREALEGVVVAVSPSASVTSRLLTIEATARTPDSATVAANAIAEALVSWDTSRVRGELERLAESTRTQILTIDVGGPPADADAGVLGSVRSQLAQDLAVLSSLSAAPLPSVRVVEPASAASLASPRPTLYAALAFAATFSLSMGFSLLRLAFDDRIRSVSAAAEASGLPVLAELPRVDTRARAYRHGLALLASQVDRAQEGGRPTVVLVTSPSESRTRSLVAVTLAGWFANDGANTVLVDTDSQMGTASKVLGLKAKPDFDDFVRRPHDPSLKPSPLKVGGRSVLRVVPNDGRNPDPRDRSTQALAAAAARLESEGEVVVLDVGPLSRTADAVVLAPHATAVVLVVTLFETVAWDLKRAVDVLRRSGVEPTGLIIARGEPFRSSPFSARRLAAPAGMVGAAVQQRA